VIILGIDTASSQVGCALGAHEGVLASFTAAHHRRHAETLAPAIDFVTTQAGIPLRDVRAIAVDVGPGLFTGLRVGIATAKALAFALRVPMIGLSSLDLLAYAHRLSNRLVVAALDARRGEVFTAPYRHVPAGVQRLAPYRVCSPEVLATELQAGGEEALVVGDGARRYADIFEPIKHVELGTVGGQYPSPADLVELAHPRALREEFVTPSELRAMYLRKPDADEAWAAALGQGASGGLR
jgi:tRNA threonylcarbamoyladenosine biosynthesis protein TsaB